MRSLIANAERVARTAIRDLEGVPLYIVTPRADSMLTPTMMEGRRGFFAAHLCSMLRPDLEASGRWRGHGVAIAIDDEAPVRDHRDECDAERQIIGVLFHELAHWLSRPLVEPVHAEEAAERYERCVAQLDEPEPDVANLFQFLAHGPAFTRVICHIWHRSRTTPGGYVINPQWLIFGSSYPTLEQLPSPLEFIESLGEEFEQARRLKLRSILGIEPPDEYARLWREAGDRFQQSAAVAADL